MDIKQAFAELKTKVESYFGTEKYEFVTAKLNDGTTVIEYDGDLAKGTIVYVVGEQGKLPLPIGTYTLEDGTAFEVVDNMGTVDNVAKANEAPAEGDAPKVAPNMAEASTEQAPVAPKRVIKSQVEEQVFKIELENEIIEIDFSSILNTVNEKFSAIEKENTELKDKLNKSEVLNKEVFALVNQIADEPMTVATEKAEPIKNVLSLKEREKQLRGQFRSQIK